MLLLSEEGGDLASMLLLSEEGESLHILLAYLVLSSVSLSGYTWRRANLLEVEKMTSSFFCLCFILFEIVADPLLLAGDIITAI